MTAASQHSRPPLVVIAGVQKAGTTSMFNYFLGHPQVAPCAVKEPMYFFPQNYPVDSRARQGRDGIAAYESLFAVSPTAKIRLEATASYIHIAGCLERLLAYEPELRVVLSFRDPIERLLSWYKMVRMLGLVPDDCDVNAFVSMCFAQGDEREAPHHLRALQHGLYAQAVSSTKELLGAERLKLIIFDELKAQPREHMQDLARWLGLQVQYFEDMSFVAHFESLEVTDRRALNRYLQFKAGLVPVLRRLGALRTCLRPFKARLENRVIGAVTDKAKRPILSPEMERLLVQYYAADVADFTRVMGRPVPWSSRYA